MTRDLIISELSDKTRAVGLRRVAVPALLEKGVEGSNSIDTNVTRAPVAPWHPDKTEDPGAR